MNIKKMIQNLKWTNILKHFLKPNTKQKRKFKILLFLQILEYIDLFQEIPIADDIFDFNSLVDNKNVAKNRLPRDHIENIPVKVQKKYIDCCI